jgi:hypothetical protein
LLEQFYDLGNLVYVDALDSTYDVRFIPFKEIHRSTNTPGRANVRTDVDAESAHVPASIAAIGDEQ